MLEKRTVALEPLPSSGTSSVSRSVPNSRVATTIRTGMNSPRRLPDAHGVSLTVVAVVASCRYAAANARSLMACCEAGSSSAYIWW